MSDFRRKILSIKQDAPVPPIPTKGWEEITRVTTVGTTQITIPSGYDEIGFFIIGGGGSGHGDFYNSGNSGNGGNGGCVNYFEVPYTLSACSVTVGKGGDAGQSKGNSNNGVASSVTYDGSTYTSAGGYGGYNGSGNNTKQENGGIGGSARWGGYYGQDMFDWCSTHTPLDGSYPTSTWAYGSKGEDGLPNPFDENDTSLYGAGGGAGQNSYDIPSGYVVGPAMQGGLNGGGAGGYGTNNSQQNRGQSGSFYGAGGGGGSFSSNHTYGQGGAGYQGIVIIYGKCNKK